MAEVLVPSAGVATAPQIGREILVPASGIYTSKAATPPSSVPSIASVSVAGFSAAAVGGDVLLEFP